MFREGGTAIIHGEKVEQAHDLFRSLVQAMLGRMATIWADQNLSLPQVRLLFVLAHIGPSSIGEIAERLHIGQSAASLLVDRLVQARLAERTDDPADRRRAIVHLTPRSEALMGRTHAGAQRLHVWLSDLDDTHLATLIEALTAMLDISGSDEPFAETLHP